MRINYVVTKHREISGQVSFLTHRLKIKNNQFVIKSDGKNDQDLLVWFHRSVPAEFLEHLYAMTFQECLVMLRSAYHDSSLVMDKSYFFQVSS